MPGGAELRGRCRSVGKAVGGQREGTPAFQGRPKGLVPGLVPGRRSAAQVDARVSERGHRSFGLADVRGEGRCFNPDTPHRAGTRSGSLCLGTEPALSQHGQCGSRGAPHFGGPPTSTVSRLHAAAATISLVSGASSVAWPWALRVAPKGAPLSGWL